MNGTLSSSLRLRSFARNRWLWLAGLTALLFCAPVAPWAAGAQNCSAQETNDTKVRQWTSRNGQYTVNAELLDVKDGTVVLRREDGEVIEVPFDNLSLADVRYAREAANSVVRSTPGENENPFASPAQASDTGGNSPAGQPPAGGAAAPQMRYRWQPKKLSIYDIEISLETGARITGSIEVLPQEVKPDGAQVSLAGNLVEIPQRMPTLRPERGFYSSFEPSPAQAFIQPNGKLSEDAAILNVPPLFANALEYVYPPLPDRPGMQQWGGTDQVTISLVAERMGLLPGRGNREVVLIPVKRTAEYRLTGRDGSRHTIARKMQLETMAEVGLDFELQVQSEIVFDTELGELVSDNTTFRSQVEIGGVGVTVPGKLTVRRLSDDEVAQRVKKAQEQLEAQREEQRRLQTPFTREELDRLIERLRSGDKSEIRGALSAMSLKQAKTPDPELSKALVEAYKAQRGSMSDYEFFQIFADWADQNAVPVLIEALEQSDSSTAVNDALDALGRLTPAEGIAPICRHLAENPHSFSARRALENYGPAAEDEVLKLLDHKDDTVISTACVVLQEIGTSKSLAKLQVLANTSSGLVRIRAQIAVDAIKARTKEHVRAAENAT